MCGNEELDAISLMPLSWFMLTCKTMPKIVKSRQQRKEQSYKITSVLWYLSNTINNFMHPYHLLGVKINSQIIGHGDAKKV